MSASPNAVRRSPEARKPTEPNAGPPAQMSEPPPILRARPLQGPIDLEATVADIERRFPKTLARLAE